MSMPPTPPRQPPDPADLARHPPRDPICARIRGLIRDYADGELLDVERNLVDLHVHRCRECGLSLARAEHEVLRLRRAGAGARVSVPAGFAARTVHHLMTELGREPVADANAAPRSARSRWLGALLLGVAALLVGALWFSAWGEVERRSRAVVETASRAIWETAAGTGVLVPGLAVPEGAVVHLDPSGSLCLKWQVQAGGRLAAASLELQGGARLRVEGSDPILLSGTAGVEAHRATALQVADGSRVELEPGRYHLDAVEIRSFDQRAAAREPSLRVRLEVMSGEGARVLRGSLPRVPVAAGEVAVWESWTAVAVEKAGDVEVAAARLRGAGPAAASPAAEGPALAGTVFELPAGTPSPGARVSVRFPGADGPASWHGETDAAGAFRVPPTLAVTGDFAVVRLEPPAGRDDLGVPAPQVLPVERTPTGARIPEALALAPGPEVHGAVLDAEQRAVEGVRILPCLIDELFGCVLPLQQGEVVSDSRGGFAVRGLPAALGPHQQVGLLLLHPAHASRCHPIPAPGSLALRGFPTQLVLEGLAAVAVRGLAPDQAFEVLEALGGLPDGSAVRVHRIHADAAGQANLRAGAGSLWLREGSLREGSLREGSGATARVRRLQPVDDQPERTVEPAAAAPEWAGSLAGLLPIQGTDFMVTWSFRGEDFTAAAEGTTVLAGAVAEVSGRPVPRAQLYTLVPGGRRGARLIGLEDGNDAVLGVLEAGAVLVALAEDGSVGVAADVDPAAGRALVRMREPGTLLLGETLRPRPEDPVQVVALQLVRRGGPFQSAVPALVRFACGAEGWLCKGVPPGDYDVRVPGARTWTVQVLPAQTVLLQ